MGRPRAAYHKDAIASYLVYAEKNGGTWEYDQLSPAASVGDLIFDDNDNPLLVARRWEDVPTNWVLFYSRASDGEWSVEPIVGGGDFSTKISLALGPDSEPRAFFHDYDSDAYYYYGRPENGSWEEVASFEYNGGPLSASDLLVDDEGVSHLLFYGNNGIDEASGLIYATDADGTWNTRIVDANVGSFILGVSLFAALSQCVSRDLSSR
ncbi:MAG: hypothetical protein M5R36_18825 [Deltaproteobacteria bacterium]|nr:hypothetical protein [Deltaproteobacteria bacterium]